MKLRIKKHQTLVKEIRESLRTEIQRAIKELGNHSPASRAKRIHKVRSRIKKVRAALRLLEGTTPHHVSHTDHHLLRDAAREIAAMREADANVATMEKLRKRKGIDALRFSKTLLTLDQHGISATKDAASSMRRASTLLKGMLSRLDNWESHPLTLEKIQKSLKRMYKHGRDAFEKAEEFPTLENFHQLRKRTKDLYLNLRLAADANPKGITPATKRARKIGKILGEDHDLGLLDQVLRKSGADKEKQLVRELIEARRSKLQARAVKMASRFYSVKPGVFISKLNA